MPVPGPAGRAPLTPEAQAAAAAQPEAAADPDLPGPLWREAWPPQAEERAAETPSPPPDPVEGALAASAAAALPDQPPRAPPPALAPVATPASAPLNAGPGDAGPAPARSASVPAETQPAAVPPRMVPSPVHQVAPVVVALAMLPGERAALRVALEPPELGRVEVRITRGADGADAVTIRVERPETLALLQRDQLALGRALDQAGLQPGGGLSLGLAGQEGGNTGREQQPGGGGAANGGPTLPGRAEALPIPPRATAALGLLDIAV